MVTQSRIGIPGTTQFLDSTTVSTTLGNAEREAVFIGDPTTTAARATVTASNPAPSSYGLVTRNVDMSFDAFNRLRVSQPTTEFGAFNEYRINPFNWVTSTTGTGAATYNTTTKRTTLSTGGTASGARAVQQSRMYLRYNPGKGLFPALTFVMGSTPPTNCAKRAGYYDDDNGLYLEWTSTGVRFVRRSNVSGSVVNTLYEQASWNVDKLDGTGTSGLTLDLTTGQIFWLDFQFLGVGSVRFGFEINGVPYLCHQVNHANLTASQPYMATANLPIRYEIVNTGTASGTGTLECICAKVDSEGGIEPVGIQYSASNGVTAKSTTTTLIPLLSIRPGPTFNGITNRGWIIPEAAELFGVSSPNALNVYYQIIWNATLTGASWTAVNANAMGQYDVTSSAVSLGTGVVIEEGYTVTNANKGGLGAAFAKVFSARPLVNSFDGTTPDTLTVAARTLSGTADLYANIAWQGLW